MHCLLCGDHTRIDVSWGQLLRLPNRRALCDICQQNMPFIRGNRCSGCSRPLHKDRLCRDCIWWENRPNPSYHWNYSIYMYDEFMKNVMTLWKYRSDYVLADIFKDDWREHFIKKFSFLNRHETLIVPIPLSDERMIQRRFNQAQVLADFLPYPSQHDALTRLDAEKQAKKSRSERLLRQNPFQLMKPIKKTVILVDDIYTTGTTIRQAASVLNQSGCQQIYAYTLIRG